MRTGPCRLSVSEMSLAVSSARVTLVVELPPWLPLYLQVCSHLMFNFHLSNKGGCSLTKNSCWNPSGMWCCTDGWVGSNISKDHIVFIFKIKQSKMSVSLDCSTIWPQFQEVLTQLQYGTTCQKTCIVINTAAWTSNAAVSWTLLAWSTLDCDTLTHVTWDVCADYGTCIVMSWTEIFQLQAF
jgi:hypothetical protein